jgi:hypothetical protein
MTQWKDKTRGGDPVENIQPMGDRTWKWEGEVVRPDGSRSTLTWTERGYNGSLEKPRKDDLIPIEPEAPSPAKVRVDLALAAHSLQAAVLNFERAEDAKDKAGEALFNAFVASDKTEVVVKIDGDYYRFWTNTVRVLFRKIEVL